MAHCDVTACIDPGDSDRPYVCSMCHDTSAAALASLPSVYSGLRSALRKSRSAHERVSVGSPGSSPPLRVVILDFTSDLHATISDADAWGRTQLRRLPAPRARLDDRFNAAVASLGMHWSELLHDALGGPWLASTVIAYRDRAFELLKWSTLWHELPLPCPRCELLALVRDNGSDWVHCTECGYRMTGSTYDDAVGDAVRPELGVAL